MNVYRVAVTVGTTCNCPKPISNRCSWNTETVYDRIEATNTAAARKAAEDLATLDNPTARFVRADTVTRVSAKQEA